MLAFGAGHVIAALVLEAHDAAIGAEFALIAALPIDELLVNFTATVARVSHFTALEANSGAALAAFGSFLKLALPFHIVHTVGPWAPQEVRADFDIDIQLKAEIFLINFLGAKPLDILRPVARGAPSIHARDQHYITVSDIGHEVV